MKKDEKSPNVSGSFQIVTEEQKKDLNELKKQGQIDDESLYYARLFMED